MAWERSWPSLREELTRGRSYPKGAANWRENSEMSALVEAGPVVEELDAGVAVVVVEILDNVFQNASE